MAGKRIHKQGNRQLLIVTNSGKSGGIKHNSRGVVTTTSEGVGRPNDGLTRSELLALPVVIDITTAARALGLGRSTAYELARRGEFPCRVLRMGNSYRVPTADLLRVLGIEPGEQQAPPPAA